MKQEDKMAKLVNNNSDNYQIDVDCLFDNEIYKSIKHIDEDVYKKMDAFFSGLSDVPKKQQKKYIFDWSEKAFEHFRIKGFVLFPLLFVTGGENSTNDQVRIWFGYIAEYLLKNTGDQYIYEIVNQYLNKNYIEDSGSFCVVINDFRKILCEKHKRNNTSRQLLFGSVTIFIGLIIGFGVGFLVGFSLPHNMTQPSENSVSQISEQSDTESLSDTINASQNSNNNSENSIENSANENSSESNVDGENLSEINDVS